MFKTSHNYHQFNRIYNITQNTKEISVIQVIPTIQPKTIGSVSELPKLTQIIKNNINRIIHKMR